MFNVYELTKGYIEVNQRNNSDSNPVFYTIIHTFKDYSLFWKAPKKYNAQTVGQQAALSKKVLVTTNVHTVIRNLNMSASLLMHL